ncbi:hypothetical protein Pla52o_02570 [Novipirellula galeiformis]|uniref:Uncharacterized protein n=1 Tax=Novipirellula galeiformis TaxID=2528004 RepID=A0A5C6CS67_9BACT|nr:hypothetical protein Pla52o_02570 [Novipirellula galeiformis]
MVNDHETANVLSRVVTLPPLKSETGCSSPVANQSLGPEASQSLGIEPDWVRGSSNGSTAPRFPDSFWERGGERDGDRWLLSERFLDRFDDDGQDATADIV